MEKLLTRKEVAEILSVKPDTVKKWQRAGIVTPCCRLNGRPRYDLNEVINAVSKGKGGTQCS